MRGEAASERTPVETRAGVKDAFGPIHAANLFMYKPGTFAHRQKKRMVSHGLIYFYFKFL